MKIEVEDFLYGIKITIPRKVLKFAAENNPENALIIHDDVGFQSYVVEQLKGRLYDPESGLTGLEQLLDKCIIEAATDCPEEVAQFKDLM